MFRWLKEYRIQVRQGWHRLATAPKKGEQAEKVMGSVFLSQVVALC